MRRSDSELSPSACGPLPPPPCPNRPKSPFPALMAYVAIPRPRRRPNPIGKSSAEDDDDDDDDARTRPKPIGQSSSASVAAPRDAASPRATPPPPPREDALARRPAARLAAEASRDIVVDASRYVPAPTLRTRHHARLLLLFLPGVFPPVSRARQVRSFTHHSVSIFDRVTFQLTDRQTRAFVSRRFVSCTKSVARAADATRGSSPRRPRWSARAAEDGGRTPRPRGRTAEKEATARGTRPAASRPRATPKRALHRRRSTRGRRRACARFDGRRRGTRSPRARRRARGRSRGRRSRSSGAATWAAAAAATAATRRTRAGIFFILIVVSIRCVLYTGSHTTTSAW